MLIFIARGWSPRRCFAPIRINGRLIITKHRYPGQYAEGLSGELYPDVLSYTPDDWVALQAWCVWEVVITDGTCAPYVHRSTSSPHPLIHSNEPRVYRACPASICRAADRSFVPDASEEAAKEAAFQAWAGASSMASQPNTGATWLHYGTDHFQVRKSRNRRTRSPSIHKIPSTYATPPTTTIFTPIHSGTTSLPAPRSPTGRARSSRSAPTSVTPPSRCCATPTASGTATR